MVPGVVHSVYTYEHSVCRGRHFLRYDYMSATYRACRETAEHKDDTNEVLPITLFYVALMSIALADEEFVRRMQLGVSMCQNACNASGGLCFSALS